MMMTMIMMMIDDGDDDYDHHYYHHHHHYDYDYHHLILIFLVHQIAYPINWYVDFVYRNQTLNWRVGQHLLSGQHDLVSSFILTLEPIYKTNEV